jgi:formate-dependent nitrite reductase membrane component NrfD
MSERDQDDEGTGRNIDPSLGTLSGEGAAQRVVRGVVGYPLPRGADGMPAPAPADAPVPSRSASAPSTTYYDMPALKRPVWKHYIPAYFYAGGVAGSAAVLAGAAQLGGAPLRRLVRRARWISLAACGASAVLLILDLGRPARFLNMLRVFRPSSPMNMGTWILSTAGGAVGTAALLSGRRGALGRVGDVAGGAAAVAGLPLSGYTAVLLANTAVPIWQGARRTLPFLFVASAAASTASLLELLPGTAAERRVLHVLGLGGKLAELGAMMAVTVEVTARGSAVAAPLRRGTSGRLWKVAAAAGVASLALSLLSKRRGTGQARRAAAGLLGTAAALAVRFAVAEAGKASARDPRATFEPQRARLGRAASEIGAPLASAEPARSLR